MPSRIDEAGHTKAFDDPVAEHWGEVKERNGPWWDSNPQVLTPMSPKSNALPLTLPRQGNQARFIMVQLPKTTTKLSCVCFYF